MDFRGIGTIDYRGLSLRFAPYYSHMYVLYVQVNSVLRTRRLFVVAGQENKEARHEYGVLYIYASHDEGKGGGKARPQVSPLQVTVSLVPTYMYGATIDETRIGHLQESCLDCLDSISASGREETAEIPSVTTQSCVQLVGNSRSLSSWQSLRRGTHAHNYLWLYALSRRHVVRMPSAY